MNDLNDATWLTQPQYIWHCGVNGTIIVIIPA